MNKLIEKPIFKIAMIAALAIFPAFLFAQNPQINQPPRPVTAAPVVVVKFPIPHPFMNFGANNYNTSEKSIKVDSAVNVSLDCVSDAKIKINGWNRNEVRVFGEGGSEFSFKVLQKSSKTGDPVWIKILGVQSNNKNRTAGDCVSGGEIEIDLPLNATVNISGREVVTRIDSVKRVKVETIGGDITLRRISEGITASAGVGDITVEGSNGSMMLDSTTGNILVFEAGPSEIGDIFKAKTHSGAIFLQRVSHRQIDLNSISGSVAFSSEILSGGSYRMSTTKGSILMSIPADSSGQIVANYGYGTFNSEIPIKIATETISEGPLKTIVGTIGNGGDAILKLASNNGSISIKKL